MPSPRDTGAQPDNRTIELETSDLKAMEQSGVVKGGENKTVGLLTTDLIEVGEGEGVDLDAKVEIAQDLAPRAPVLPAITVDESSPAFQKTEIVNRVAEVTQLVDRMSVPTSAAPAPRDRGLWIVVGVYAVAIAALALALYERFG